MTQSSFPDPHPDILIRNLDEAHKSYSWVASINDLTGPELNRFHKALTDEGSQMFFHSHRFSSHRMRSVQAGIALA
jgi:hypothetical protein